MFYRTRRLYQPEFYQGPNRLGRYFEGWYYKTVIGDRAFSLIPGVSRAPDDPHAFVQYVDGDEGRSVYHRFPLDAFSYRKDVFEISIGEHRFSSNRFAVKLPDFTCDLTIGEARGWPSSLFSPGTMGWYSFVPFMECRHGIIVMDAKVSGKVDGAPVSGGRFYMEKDYGRSFPNAWVWLQSNSFELPGVSVTCSVGNVPFIGGAFTGFLAAILHQGELHRFTTYTGGRLVSLSTTESEVSLRLEDRRKSLDIRATREPGAILAAPSDGLMSGRIAETLRSTVSVRLVVDGTVRFDGVGSRAGLEVVAPERLETAS